MDTNSATSCGVKRPGGSIVHSLGDGQFIGGGCEFMSGVFGGTPFAWKPTDLDGLLQWLTSFSAPSTAVDSSDNAIDALYRQSNCVALDGVGDTLDSEVKMVGGQPVNFEVEYLYKTRQLTDAIFSSSSGSSLSKGLLLRVLNSTTIRIYVSDGVAQEFVSFTIPALVDGTKYTLGFDWDGVSGAPILTLNGVEYVADGSIDAWSGDSGENIWLFSQANSVRWLDADVYYAKMDGYFHYTFSDSAAGLTERDVSGNGNDGTWTVGAGGIETLRSGRQDVFHANAKYGASKYLSFNGVDAYSDTGHYPTLDTEWEEEMEWEDMTGTVLVGSFDGSVARSVQFGLVSGSFNAYFFLESATGITGYEGRHVFKINKTGFYIDGVQKASWDATSGAQITPRSIYSGARNVSGAASGFVEGRWHSTVIRENGVEVVSSKASKAYGEDADKTIVNDTGGDYLAFNADFGYLQADQSNPGYDVDGNVLTNPPCGNKLLLNNTEAGIQQTFEGSGQDYPDTITVTGSGEVFINDTYEYSGLGGLGNHTWTGVENGSVIDAHSGGGGLFLWNFDTDVFVQEISASYLPPTDQALWIGADGSPVYSGTGPSPILSYEIPEEPDFKSNPFWSADGVNFDIIYYEDCITHPNFLYNVLVKMLDVDGLCVVSEIATWPIDYAWTPNTYPPTARYFNSDCGAAPLEPVTHLGEYVTHNGYIVLN